MERKPEASAEAPVIDIKLHGFPVPVNATLFLVPLKKPPGVTSL
jgi:hypothetical protein